MGNVINSASIKHPETFNLVKGATELSREITSVNESIRLILTSAKGELFGDPAFGSRLYEFFFDQMTENLDYLITLEIVTALNTQETRIKVKDSDIKITHEDRNVIIDISYELTNINYRDSYTHVISIDEGGAYNVNI